MEVTEIKTRLLHHIDKVDQDVITLTKILNYVESIVSGGNQKPSITDEGLASNIKDDCDIIVPIVCDDMFEYIKDGQSLSIGNFLSDRFKSGKKMKDEIVEAIQTDLFFGLSLFEQEQRGRDLSHSLYEALSEGIDKGCIKLKDCVKDFLSKGDFPVIITTIGFPVIESALTGKSYESIWYNPNNRNDLPFLVNKDSRVVYHIFGGERSNSWVYNEQTLLKFMHALHSGDFGAKNLANYLRGAGNESIKRPLVLGSTLPDWLFRLFVYPLYGDKLSESSGYWISLDNIEKGLDMFLSRNKYIGQTNLREGNLVNNILSEATVEHKAERQKEHKPYKLFVSYKREKDKENAEIIERIFAILERQAKASGGEVWRDTKQVADGGNPYWANIKKAIKDCNLFIPLVSSPYLDEFKDAPDITKYAEEPIEDAGNDKANDDEKISALKPVIREAYYAIAYGKTFVPIVIDNNELDGGIIERIIRNPSDNRNLPSCAFLERTALVHDNNDAKFFNLPKID